MSETDMTDYAELREEKSATPHNELIAQLLDSRVPKSEREHAAAREIERLRAQVEGTAAQRPAEDGCHCATCTCNPNMTPAVRFDLSPAQTEGAIREHLIRLGWTPPDERARGHVTPVTESETV